MDVYFIVIKFHRNTLTPRLRLRQLQKPNFPSIMVVPDPSTPQRTKLNFDKILKTDINKIRGGKASFFEQ